MNRIALPYTTVTDGISVFDTANQYRPRLWDSMSNKIDWLNEQDNGMLLTLIEKFSPMAGKSLNEPVIWWTEDSRLNIHTDLSATATDSAATITVDDARIAVVGTFLFTPADGEVMKVTGVNYTTNVITVTRGYNGTAASAKSIDDKVISLSQYMAELGDLPEGNGRLPGTARWNCISIVSSTFKVSKMQQNSFVLDGWGQVEQGVLDTLLDVRRQVGKALLFNSRGATDTGADGMEYISQGLLHYIQTGMLDLGQINSNLTWPILNDFMEARFEPDASGQTKELLAGLWLFKAIQRLVRDAKGVTVTPYFEPALGTMVYTISTDSGYTVNVILDRFGLAVNEGLGDWGFLLDMPLISGAQYNGFEFQWLQNVQPARSVMYREDAYLGSFSLILKHETCHGVIRGAGKPIVNR